MSHRLPGVTTSPHAAPRVRRNNGASWMNRSRHVPAFRLLAVWLFDLKGKSIEKQYEKMDSFRSLIFSVARPKQMNGTESMVGAGCLQVLRMFQAATSIENNANVSL